MYDSSTPAVSVSSENAKPASGTDIVETACKAAELIKSESYDKLAEMVHPEDERPFYR